MHLRIRCGSFLSGLHLRQTVHRMSHRRPNESKRGEHRYDPRSLDYRLAPEHPALRPSELSFYFATGDGDLSGGSRQPEGCQGWQARIFLGAPNGESGGTPAELKEGWKSMGKLFITASDRSAFKQYQRVGRAR